MITRIGFQVILTRYIFNVRITPHTGSSSAQKLQVTSRLSSSNEEEDSRERLVRTVRQGLHQCDDIIGFIENNRDFRFQHKSGICVQN